MPATALIGLAASPTGAALAIWQQTADASLAVKVAVVVAIVAVIATIVIGCPEWLRLWLPLDPRGGPAWNLSRFLVEKVPFGLVVGHTCDR